MSKLLYVGLDVHKETISVTTAEEGRMGTICFIGTIPNTPTDIARMAKRLNKNGHQLEFCYEAGGCGYGIYRQILELGHGCLVAAPSLIARKPGDHIKNDRRDSQKLAIQHRAGNLTPVWVPDPVHEAIRDLVRARMDAATQLTRARQQCLAFLLRHGRIYGPNKKNWTIRHRTWLGLQTFEQKPHQIVFQDYVEAVWAAQERREQLETRITTMLAEWSMAPVVDALRAMRGLDTMSAVIFMSTIGDLGRFETPRQLMAYLGLVPSEQSSGSRIWRGGITKAGNAEARRVLVEAAWSYRYPPRLASEKIQVVAKQAKAIRDIAWKAQLRLCERYRKLSATGKKPTVVVTAIARELCGFIWAIGREVTLTQP
ncbi:MULTISPECIES: IS110 family RNA-guided transposase [Acetobacteraceae]|nr:IS110 family transposase [Gluconacetobacter entanii]AHI27141.1 Putative transposase [Komagataeibacter xylinus E25]AHI27233.1 Putative transposase [Komagataeibacter xylinus E25]AHI27257.1 Putative transposase [Komagataeibacter xylinus E25]GCE81772.1 transposase [Komagataeibacter oboediens]